jgi:CO/xanthine dehydrogenase FAD-binding subunit
MHYVRVDTAEQAVEEISGGGMPLAGGTVVAPRLSSGLSVRRIVDISRTAELDGVVSSEEGTRLGAMCRLDALTRPLARGGSFTSLMEAASAVGNPHVRRAATLGGNLAVGLPGSDLLPALLVLDAEMMIASPEGEHVVPLEEYPGSWRHLSHLITGIRLPVRRRWRSGFTKYAWRRASGKTIANVAAAVLVDGDVIVEMRIAAGAFAGEVPRLKRTEETLTGSRLDDDLAEAAAHAAGQEVVWRPGGPAGESYCRSCVASGVRDLLRRLR